MGPVPLYPSRNGEQRLAEGADNTPEKVEMPGKRIPGHFDVVCRDNTEQANGWFPHIWSRRLDDTNRVAAELDKQTATGRPPGVERTKGFPRGSPAREGRPGALKVQNQTGSRRRAPGSDPHIPALTPE